MKIFYSSAPFLHPSMPDHPERPHRLLAAYDGLRALPRGRVEWCPLPPAPSQDILHLAERGHHRKYLEDLIDLLPATTGFEKLDGGDTVLSRTSLSAAAMALSGARQAAGEIMTGITKTAFLLARPPGHHARPDEAMGFCLTGTAAETALYLRDVYQARVAVLDFDLHHGNGTEDILRDEHDIFLASSHEENNWPGTGQDARTGKYDHIRNALLEKGSGQNDMREVWDKFLAEVAEFGPDIILLSAGFDCHANDPLSGLDWRAEDYAWLGGRIAEVADECCHGRVLGILEGGYDLSVLQTCLPVFASALSELDAPSPEGVIPVAALDGLATPYIGGVSTLLYPSKDTYKVSKAHRRIWIEAPATGAMLYTLPSFLRAPQSREVYEALVCEANSKGVLSIGDIIAFEQNQPRKAGYNPGGILERTHAPSVQI